MAFTLSSEQFATFKNHAWESWCEAAGRDLYQAYPQYYAAFGASAEGLVPMVRAVASWGQRYNIISRADGARLCQVAAALGHRFWQDPRLRGHVSASKSPDIPADRRASALVRYSKAWLRDLWADENLRAFSERLSDAVTGGLGPQRHIIERVLPGHGRLFSAVDSDRVLHWLSQSAPEPVRDGGPRQLTFCACALVHGPQWLSDPQYPRLAKVLLEEADAVRLATLLSDIYSEATA